MKLRQRYVYRCDGGINPGHHQAKNIEVYHDMGTGRTTIGLNEVVADKKEAERILCERYDVVSLEFIQTTSTKEMKLGIKGAYIDW
jgi:hypothetical protein